MRHLLFLVLSFGLLGLASCEKGIKTENGFRFVHHTNNGGAKPQPGQTIKVHVYTHIGDSLMSSTRSQYPEGREITLYPKDQLPKRVPAVYDAALLMGEGDSATVYEAIDTLIRKYVPPALKDEKEVRYTVVLVDVVTDEEKKQAQAASEARFVAVQEKMNQIAADYKAGKLQLQTLPSGLKMLVEDKGSGGPVVVGQPVKTQYYGCLPDGKMFDNSFQRGTPLEFGAGIGQMIPGFDEGVQQLNHGGKAVLFLPSKLGYGESGTPDGAIPPNSEIIFYVEVL
jgi:FKBP-type peptidyl-prolyl cis-trans isomerase FkpA